MNRGSLILIWLLKSKLVALLFIIRFRFLSLSSYFLHNCHTFRFFQSQITCFEQENLFNFNLLSNFFCSKYVWSDNNKKKNRQVWSVICLYVISKLRFMLVKCKIDHLCIWLRYVKINHYSIFIFLKSRHW